jgi:protein TonB
MHSRNFFPAILIVFLSFSNGMLFAQIKPKSAKETKVEVKKVAEKTVTVTTHPYPDADAPNVLVSYNDLKVSFNEDSDKIYAATEVKAEYPGGLEAFTEYIFTHYKSPTDKEIHSKVYFSFVVEKDGTLSDIKVIRDAGYGIGQEILKIIKTSPKWKPAIQNGKVVRSLNSFPFSIKTK